MDVSGSMGESDKTPFHPEISKTQFNRFGCAIQALHDYVNKRSLVNIKDKLTLVLFNDEIVVRTTDIMNFEGFSRDIQKQFKPKGGTDFNKALIQLDTLLENNIGDYPLMIFLSDGSDKGIQGQIKEFIGIESKTSQTMQKIAQKQVLQKKKASNSYGSFR